jgi:hypothetical protein
MFAIPNQIRVDETEHQQREHAPVVKTAGLTPRSAARPVISTMPRAEQPREVVMNLLVEEEVAATQIQKRTPPAIARSAVWVNTLPIGMANIWDVSMTQDAEQPRRRGQIVGLVALVETRWATRRSRALASCRGARIVLRRQPQLKLYLERR